jgi:plastocyanin
MSILGRNISGKVVAGIAALIVVASLLPVISAAPEREVTLVVRDMTFYLESDPYTPNPTIDVAAGERVRVVLKNEDRGMTHDFSVPTFAAATALLDWSESDDVTFDVPSTPGTYEYVCNPHRLMMRGIVRVTTPRP